MASPKTRGRYQKCGKDFAIAAEDERDPAKADLSRWTRARGELIDGWGRRRAA